MKSLVMAVSLIAIAATGVQAQDADDSDDTEVITVTSTKREESIKDVPFSVNALSEEEMRRAGVQNLEDVSRNVAGLAIQNLGPGQSQVAIRGVSAGQIVRDQPGVKEQVGVYLDETVISLSLFTPDLDLFDLDRVEVLRGPQGTLFGSGNVGGTIRYITTQPKLGVTEGALEGDFNAIDGGGIGGYAKGVINFPLGDNAAMRIVGFHTKYGGFIDGLMEDGKVNENVNSGTRSGFRAALRWEPTENVTITPRIIYQSVATDGFNRQEVFNLFANPYTTTRPAIQFDERQQFLHLREAFEDDLFIADGTINVDFGDVALISISSYTDRSILASRDASALTGSVSVDLGFPDAAVLIPSNLRDTTDVSQFTQEARLYSDYESRFQWLLGVFYTKLNRDYAQRLPTPGYDAYVDAAFGAGTSDAVSNGYGPDSPYNSDLPYDIKQFAIFGEASYDLTERLQVTAGGRWYDFNEERAFVSGGLFSNGDNRTDKTSSSGFTPRVMVSYDLNDEVTLNAQASQGFRLGGVNDPLNITLCTDEDEAIFGSFQTYDDETLWNYEVGAKMFRSGLSLTTAAFYTDISNLQVTLDAGSCSSRISFNVPEAHTLGIEAELAADIAEGLSVSLSGSLVQAEFDSTVRDGSGNVLGGVEEGNRLPSVPEFQFAATASYVRPLSWAGEGAEGFISASIQHVGSRFTQPSDQVPGAGDFVSNLPFGGASGLDVTSLDLELDPYQIVNFNAGIDYATLNLMVYVNNAFDENANLSFDRERGGRARLGFRTNQPRTFGVRVRKSF